MDELIQKILEGLKAGLQTQLESAVTEAEAKGYERGKLESGTDAAISEEKKASIMALVAAYKLKDDQEEEALKVELETELNKAPETPTEEPPVETPADPVDPVDPVDPTIPPLEPPVEMPPTEPPTDVPVETPSEEVPAEEPPVETPSEDPADPMPDFPPPEDTSFGMGKGRGKKRY